MTHILLVEPVVDQPSLEISLERSKGEEKGAVAQ